MDCIAEIFTQRTRKINRTSPRASLSDWLTLEFMPYPCLGIWDPHPHLMGQPLKKRPTRCNVRLVVPIMPYLLTSYVVDLCVALVSTFLGSVSISLAARFSTAANSGTLVNGRAKIRAAREYGWCPHSRPHLRMGRKVLEDINRSGHHGGL